MHLKFSDDTEPVPADPAAESEEELQDLVRDLIRNSGQSGRTFSTASPDVALRLPDGSRLQALHPEITGDRTFVTIRRHRLQDATLQDLVQRGATDATIASLLGACVRARRNIMVVGEQSSGKTTLLRALLKEIPQHERFGTIETEFELWAHRNGYHTQVVPMEGRESNGERVAAPWPTAASSTPTPRSGRDGSCNCPANPPPALPPAEDSTAGLFGPDPRPRAAAWCELAELTRTQPGDEAP